MRLLRSQRSLTSFDGSDNARLKGFLLGPVLLLALATGCSDLEGDAVTAGSGAGTPGDPCAGDGDCRPGLTCEVSLCTCTIPI